MEGNIIGKHSVTPVKKFLAFKQCSSAEQYEGLAYFYMHLSPSNMKRAISKSGSAGKKCVPIFFQSTVTGVHGANGEPAPRRVARQATQGFESERGSATVLNPRRMV